MSGDPIIDGIVEDLTSESPRGVAMTDVKVDVAPLTAKEAIARAEEAEIDAGRIRSLGDPNDLIAWAKDKLAATLRKYVALLGVWEEKGDDARVDVDELERLLGPFPAARIAAAKNAYVRNDSQEMVVALRNAAPALLAAYRERDTLRAERDVAVSMYDSVAADRTALRRKAEAARDGIEKALERATRLHEIPRMLRATLALLAEDASVPVPVPVAPGSDALIAEALRREGTPPDIAAWADKLATDADRADEGAPVPEPEYCVEQVFYPNVPCGNPLPRSAHPVAVRSKFMGCAPIISSLTFGTAGGPQCVVADCPNCDQPDPKDRHRNVPEGQRLRGEPAFFCEPAAKAEGDIDGYRCVTHGVNRNICTSACTYLQVAEEPTSCIDHGYTPGACCDIHDETFDPAQGEVCTGCYEAAKPEGGAS